MEKEKGPHRAVGVKWSSGDKKVHILALPRISHVTLGKFPNLLKPQFPLIQNGDNNTANITALWCGWKETTEKQS